MQTVQSSESWSTPIRDELHRGSPYTDCELNCTWHRELPGNFRRYFISTLSTHTITGECWNVQLGNRFVPPRRIINQSENIYSPIIRWFFVLFLSPIPINCLASFVRFIAFQGDFAYLVMILNSKYLSNGIVFRWKSCPAMRNPWCGKCLPTQILRHKVHWQIFDTSKEWSPLIFVFLLFLKCRLKESS